MQTISHNTSGHAAYSIMMHFVFVTKYRHECMNSAMLAVIREQAQSVTHKWRCELVEFNGEADHVHLLVSMHPTVAVAELVANLKTTTARRLRSQFAEDLKPDYWKPVFWSSAYAAFSVGANDLETVIRYIRNQESPE